MLVPNYMQTWGLVRAFGATVKEWPLIEDREAGRWRPDLDALSRVVSDRTRLIIICTPNNPTGARLTPEELDAIGRIADRLGAWVLSDEVYRGAELDGHETASMWGRGERVIVTSGLSKAYGLPGLRIGWIVATTALRRLDMVVPRLHDHRAGRAERSTGSRRARSGPAARACSNGRAASCERTCRSSKRGSTTMRQRSRGWPLKRAPSCTSATTIRSTRPSSSRGCGMKRASSSFRAITSAWTDTFGSVLASGRTILKQGLERLHQLLSALPAHVSTT